MAGSDNESVLDSWKEIASYLGRTVRTVQNWEKEEGLPIHRHQHRKGSTVYAYPSEVDAWRRERDDHEPGEPDETEQVRATWLIPAVAALIVAAGLVWLGLDRASQTDPSRRGPRFGERDRLLIAGFDNRTGEDVLEGTLEVALERDLGHHGFSSLVSRQRLGDALQLMGSPIDSRIDTDLAREIALRDRDIRAVLLGTIERSGSTYVLNLHLLDPIADAVFADLREEAAGREEILPAVTRLSLRLRESLGEVLPAPQSQLSTPSLQALQLFSRADRLFVQGNLGGTLRDDAAEQLLREAIATDPGFASSHTHLAWALKRQLRPIDEYLPHARRALELAEGATVAERYFIRGSYLQMRSEASGAVSDVEEALTQYGALLEIDPDHFWALENSFRLLGDLGRGQETLELALRSVAARPNDVAALSRAAETLVGIKGDLEEARPYVERARQLLSELPLATRPRDAFVEFYPVYELWVRGDMDRVVEEVDRIVESVGSLAAAERKDLALQAIAYYLDLGMFERAEELQELHTILPHRAWEYKMGWRRGRPKIVRKMNRVLAQSGQPRILAWVAADLALHGYLEESEVFLDRLPAEFDLAPGLVSTARGTVAFRRGSYDEAIFHLERGVDSLRYQSHYLGYYFSNAGTLSRAWEALGEPQRALEVLEEASRQKSRALDQRTAWMRAQIRLAELYRDLGRREKALAIEDELRRYCAHADPDFPLLRELQERERRAAR